MTTRRLPSGFGCTMIPIVAERDSTISSSKGSAPIFLSSSCVSFRSRSPRSSTIFRNAARDFGNVRIGRSLKNQPTTRGQIPKNWTKSLVNFGAQYKAALYRWEFLRRNPQYRADYNEFMRCFGAWLKGKVRWPPSEFDRREIWTKSQQNYFRTKIEPVLNQLCLKWKISDLFPPDFGLEEYRQIDESDGQGEGAQFPPNRFSGFIEGDVLSTGELKRMGFLSMGNTRQYENLLLIQVDLNSPMKDLLDHTRKILKSGQENYRRQMAARGLKLPTRRRRFEDYVLHLRIWHKLGCVLLLIAG